MESISDLPPLKPGDLFALPPTRFYQRWVCNHFLEGAKTFHWGLITHRFRDQSDYGTSESLGKGVSVGWLSFYRDEPIRIYRVKGQPEGLDLATQLCRKAHDHGRDLYDYPVFINVGLWFILKRLGIKAKVQKDARFYCQEYVVHVWKELGVDLIPDSEYPVCKNLEESPELELIYKDF
jgi:hypothetical protein